MTETQCVIGSPEWMRSVDRRLTELNRKITELSLPKITINPTVEENAIANSEKNMLGKLVIAKIEEHPDFLEVVAKAYTWFDDFNGDKFEAMLYYRDRAKKFADALRTGYASKVFEMVK